MIGDFWGQAALILISSIGFTFLVNKTVVSMSAIAIPGSEQAMKFNKTNYQ